MATKGSSMTKGSFLVVTSTRLSVTTQAELGNLTVFSPAQKTEANEYASIITRADASGQPAPPVDAARLAVLEGISVNMLVDLDRGDVMKFVLSARLVDFGKVAATAPPPDPLIGTKLLAVPFWNGSEIEDIAVATITSTEILYVTASDDSDASRTTRLSRVNAKKYAPRAPPPPIAVFNAQGTEHLSILKAMPLSSAIADPNALDFGELATALSGTKGGAQLLAFIRTSSSSSASVQAVKQALDTISLELFGVAMGAFTMPSNPSALGLALEAIAAPRRAAPRSASNPGGYLPRANTNVPKTWKTDANRYPLVAAIERLAMTPEVFTLVLSDVVEIFEPPPRVPLVRRFPASQTGSLEQALKRLKVTPSFISTLGPAESLSQERLWELMLEWSTKEETDTASSSADTSSTQLAAVIAAVQASTMAGGDSKTYSLTADLDAQERTALRSSVISTFSSSELSARVLEYHELAKRKDYDTLQLKYSEEADPDIRMIIDTPSDQFSNVVASACNTAHLNMLETIRCARSTRIESHLYGKRSVPPLAAAALKKASALRLSKLPLTELIDIKGQASGLLTNLDKLGEDAALSTFQRATMRLNQVLSLVIPDQALEAQTFLIELNDRVTTLRKASASWETISAWYCDVMKAVEAPLELSVGRRLGGFAKLDLRATLLTEDSHYSQTLQLAAIEDRINALSKKTHDHKGPKIRPGAANKTTDATPKGQFPEDVFKAGVAKMTVAHPTGCPSWHLLGKCYHHEQGRCKKTHDGAAGQFLLDDSKRLPHDPSSTNGKGKGKGKPNNKRKAGN